MEANKSENIIQNLDEINSEKFTTKRVVATGLEEILYQSIPVLDKGFIRVIDYMGNDSSIVQAARVSYGKGTKKINQDTALIRYLMSHRHSTPFEMCEIKLHVKLPIFIARQWIRHRTANVNEYSARYSILSKEFYLPNKEDIAMQSGKNNQGRGTNLNEQQAEEVIRILKEDATKCYEDYEKLLNIDEKGKQINPNFDGVARELARINLNLNYYTEWYWKIDLHNFLHFLSLRADNHAQYEIRQYADILIEKVLKQWLPITYQAFLDYRKNAVFLSSQMLDALKSIINKDKSIDLSKFGLGKREQQEFCRIFSVKSL